MGHSKVVVKAAVLVVVLIAAFGCVIALNRPFANVNGDLRWDNSEHHTIKINHVEPISHADFGIESRANETGERYFLVDGNESSSGPMLHWKASCSSTPRDGTKMDYWGQGPFGKNGEDWRENSNENHGYLSSFDRTTVTNSAPTVRCETFGDKGFDIFPALHRKLPDNAVEIVLAVVAIGVGTLITIYVLLLPILIARKRKHPNLIPLAIIDLALGWAFLPWILCLAWAFAAKPKDV